MTDGPIQMLSTRVQRGDGPPFGSIVFVGGSCAGKSSAAAYLAAASARFVVAPRVTTRPSRQGDDVEQIEHLTPSEFELECGRGRLAVHWQRVLRDGSRVLYGCRPVHSGVPIWLAGEGIYSSDGDVGPDGVLDGSLIVGMYAPESIRRKRFVARSPDMLEAEGRTPLGFFHDDDRMRRHVDVIVQNHGRYEDGSFAALRDVVLTLFATPD